MQENKEKKKIGIGTVVKGIVLTITLLIFIVAGTILIEANMNPDKIPDIFGYKPMIVLSGSMESSIYAGDLAFVKEVDTTSLKENDIIAFRNETNTVTTHRIVEIVYEDGKQYFRTKGDNNNANDINLVEMDKVEGIYTGRIPKLGNFLIFLQQPIGLAVVLLIILVIGLGCLYFMNRKESKKEREEFEEYKRMKEQQGKNQEE